MDNIENKVKKAAKGLTYILETFAEKFIKIDLYDYHVFNHHVSNGTTVSINIEFKVDDPGPELHNISQVLSQIATLNFEVCKNYEINKDFVLTKRKEDFFDSTDVLGMVYKIDADVRNLKVVLTNEFDVYPDTES
jgi:hypothetical protein